MFQESALFPWLDVFGNVMFGLKLRPESEQRANAARSRIASSSWSGLRNSRTPISTSCPAA